ncbi:integrase core domain-containing protein [Scardovia wiggsiae]|uniref:integrase core domain-containing protein n=1 Tax=Scardovia wiggsiae TaxID=230143 RepID=UPI003BA92980
MGALYDNAMAESVHSAYKTELIRTHAPFTTVQALEQAPLPWVSWWNTKRVHEALGYKTPAQVEQEFYQEQKTGKPTITA